MGDDTAVRYTNTVLYDDDFNKIVGDVLLHQDGSWSESKGDEDVVEEIDGSQRVLTRSLQNWHTHLAMQLNARDFSDGYPLHRWLNEAIFPTEARITPEYVRVGTSAAAAEMIRTGSTFAADMYFFPAVTGEVLTNAGLRGLIGGPVSDAALPSHDDAESALDGTRSTSSTEQTRGFGAICHCNPLRLSLFAGNVATCKRPCTTTKRSFAHSRQ